MREPDVCARCTTHDCLRGNATQRGCETGLYLPRKAGNMNCTLLPRLRQGLPARQRRHRHRGARPRPRPGSRAVVAGPALAPSRRGRPRPRVRVRGLHERRGHGDLHRAGPGRPRGRAGLRALGRHDGVGGARPRRGCARPDRSCAASPSPSCRWGCRCGRRMCCSTCSPGWSSRVAGGSARGRGPRPARARGGELGHGLAARLRGRPAASADPAPGPGPAGVAVRGLADRTRRRRPASASPAGRSFPG